MNAESLVDQITDEIVLKLGLGPQVSGYNCRTVCIERQADQVRFFVECGADRIGAFAENPKSDNGLGKYIDHTLLKPTATKDEIESLCREADEYGFASVCVNPTWVSFAARLLKLSSAKVCTVAGFPLGATPHDVKTYEARRSLFSGAREIDMVINIGALKGGEDDTVFREISDVSRACHEADSICKVIIETAFLSQDEKVKACVLAKRAGADFVKTSTGFGPGGATVEDVALMRQVVGPDIGVKAAGGIKDGAATQEMIAAGATRIGASAGVKILQGDKGNGSTGSY